MPKFVIDAAMDAALNYIQTNATEMIACSTYPTTFEQATATYALADVVIDSSDFTGPGNGDGTGRKLTVNAQSTITVDASGTFGHVALCSSDTLLAVTTGTSQVLTAGNTVDFPAFDIWEISDPT